MKKSIFLILIGACCSVTCIAQTVDSLFLVTYTVGSSWDKDKQPHEQNFFKEHSLHLSALRKSGVIRAGARAGEEGLVILVASTLQSARDLILNDVAVKSELFNVTIAPLSVFYEGCLEKPKPKN